MHWVLSLLLQAFPETLIYYNCDENGLELRILLRIL